MAETDSQPIETFLLHDASLADELVKGISDVTPVPLAERERIANGARVLVCLSDEQIRQVAEQAIAAEWEVGILPHPEAPQAMTALGVKGELRDVISYYSHRRSGPVDVLFCNGELVFNSVVIGRVLALRPTDINRHPTQWSMLLGALKGLTDLRLKPYRLLTGKEREVKTAALGMVALGHAQSALLERAFAEDLATMDGRLTLLSLAPRSVISYLLFIARLLLPGKIRLAQLPPSLSLIQTDKLHISAPSGTEYLLDGKPVHTSEIDLEMRNNALFLLPGPALNLRDQETVNKPKETVRLNHVPVDAGASALLEQDLPLVPHATEDEYRELFVALRENAKATPSMKVLMVLSVMLAMAGLYANSAPVIIGAMILAPLMAPIVSLAMGLARTEPGLMRASAQTVLVGVGWGLGTAILFAWITPLEIPTTEMQSRMSPHLLDLVVAVVSGIAGAYASAKEEIAKSLAGVAIAVALVPPLSVVGIGIGWGDWAMAGGALLLLVTNLVGIALAGAATFLAMGFAPFKRAKAGIGFTLLVMLVIAVPLSLSFSLLVERDHIMEQVPTGPLELSGISVNISKVDVNLDRPHLVRIVLSSEKPLETYHVDELKRVITERAGEPIVLEVQSNIRR